jgi:IS30 family transposase
MPAEPLGLPEREEIRAGIERGDPFADIAVRLGRHRSTVSEEVNRNGGRGAYRATTAQQRAEDQRARPKRTRLQQDAVLASHVEARLRAKDSPMTISIELARGLHPDLGVVRLSHETIYTEVHAQGRRGLGKGLHCGLHRRRRCRKHRPAPGQEPAKGNGPLGAFNLIHTRPAEAGGRHVVGHLEGDLIIGAFNRSALVTVFDRASRYLWLASLPEGHGAEATLAALIEVIGRMPADLQRSLTWDQGREMADHDLLTAATGMAVYFADPHSPWQRPTNENGNGLIRRYVGKSTNLNLYRDTDLRAIEHRINTTPRRALGWATAHDRYAAAASR